MPIRQLPEDGGGNRPANLTLTHQPTETSPKLARDRPASVSCCVLSLAGELHMTVADRSPAPTVQNLPDNRAAMSFISRSATATTPFGGFGLMRRDDRQIDAVSWCLRYIMPFGQTRRRDGRFQKVVPI